jgi:hypothetical protein
MIVSPDQITNAQTMNVHGSPSPPNVADFGGFGGDNYQTCHSILRDQPLGIPHQMVADAAPLAGGRAGTNQAGWY